MEVGFAYTSALAVKNGKIVDGVAGTAGYPGYLGAGHLDSEVAYAISNITPLSKEMLFKGGTALISNIDPVMTLLQAFIEGRGPGYIAMVEFVSKTY
ncbi:MAG: DUF1464 family protein [Candidatus Nezhaarchaeales archaeon]